MEAQEVALTQEQCAELPNRFVDLLRGTMKAKIVKIWDNSAARAMAEIMEEEMKAYCGKCKRTTTQYLQGRYRVCGGCGRKVTVG